MFVNPIKMSDGNHDAIPCVTCHGGNENTTAKDAAHQNLVSDPSAYPSNRCVLCHKTISDNFKNSLHATQNGYLELMKKRSGQTQLTTAQMNVFNGNCGGCHVTCSQCHITRPASVKGGLVEGHKFRKTPSWSMNCTACHGSRVNEEFTGAHQTTDPSIQPDIHYNTGHFCMFCHSGDEMHGTGPLLKHRSEVTNGPKCVNCHSSLGATQRSIDYHTPHTDKVDCFVCHSQEYKQCYNCHVGTSSKGIVRPSNLDFRIGKNPLKTASRPFDFVLVRHVPVHPNSFTEWTGAADANFESVETWKYATPHNIRKNTLQTTDCNSCHGNAALYLTQSFIDTINVVDPREIPANQNVIVAPGEIPAPIP